MDGGGVCFANDEKFRQLFDKRRWLVLRLARDSGSGKSSNEEGAMVL